MKKPSLKSIVGFFFSLRRRIKSSGEKLEFVFPKKREPHVGDLPPLAINWETGFTIPLGEENVEKFKKDFPLESTDAFNMLKVIEENTKNDGADIRVGRQIDKDNG